MTRKINQTGLDHIKQWEGLQLTAYLDAAGIWTIGYGHTASAGEPEPAEGMTITEIEAEALLRRDIEQYEEAVSAAVNVELTDNQFASLVSLTYNIGIDAFLRSTLLRKLNDGYLESVPIELMKWVYANGCHLRGLANRRAAEAGLWVKGAFVSSGYVRPLKRKERALITPETLGPLLGATAGCTGLVSGSGPFQWALGAVMVIACLVGAWYFIRRIRREAA